MVAPLTEMRLNRRVRRLGSKLTPFVMPLVHPSGYVKKQLDTHVCHSQWKTEPVKEAWSHPRQNQGLNPENFNTSQVGQFRWGQQTVELDSPGLECYSESRLLKIFLCHPPVFRDACSRSHHHRFILGMRPGVTEKQE